MFSFADGSKSRRILPGWCIQIRLPACAVMLLPFPLGMLHGFSLSHDVFHLIFI